MAKDIYFYTNKSFADYIKKEKEIVKEKYGLNLSTANMSRLLLDKIIIPNNLKISDTIKPRDINLKWKKLKI